MKTSQNDINDQGKFSSKNDRYNLTGFHRDQFYIPTESNFINQNQRRVTSTTYRKNKFPVSIPVVAHITLRIYI